MWCVLTALCNDGTIWEICKIGRRCADGEIDKASMGYNGMGWVQVKDIPQDGYQA